MLPVGILPFLLLSSSDEHSLSSLSLSWFSCFFNSSRSSVVRSFECSTNSSTSYSFTSKCNALPKETILSTMSAMSPSDIHRSSNPKQLMLSGVSLLTVSNVNNPVGLVGLPCMMWSAHFFVTHIQTVKISSWNDPTVHVRCFMLVRASTKTFVSWIHIH